MLFTKTNKMIDIQKLKQFPLSFRLFETYIYKKYGSTLFLYNDSGIIKNEDIIYFFDIEDIFISSDMEMIGSDEWEFSYKITHLPAEHCLEKRRCGFFKTIYSYKEYGGTYIGAWRTRAEATDEALLKALELLEIKLKTN